MKLGHLIIGLVAAAVILLIVTVFAGASSEFASMLPQSPKVAAFASIGLIILILVLIVIWGSRKKPKDGK